MERYAESDGSRSELGGTKRRSAEHAGVGFAPTDRFVAEVAASATNPSALKPGYVWVGDETFLHGGCRKAVLKAFVPDAVRDSCLSERALAAPSIFEIPDRARAPSLMAPFQVVFVPNLKQLFPRGAKKDA